MMNGIHKINKRIPVFAALAVLAILLACGTSSCKNAQANAPGGGSDTSSLSGVKFVNVSQSSNYFKIVYPQKTDDVLKNPGMGWVLDEEPNYQGHLDLGYDGDFPEVSTITLSTAWAQVEKTEGVYDWSEIDKAVNYWSSKGKKIVMRLCTDTLQLSYTDYGVPKYLFDKYKVPYSVRTNWGRQIKMPDITNQIYLQKLQQFLGAMFERYGNNSSIEEFDLRGYGLWGEWHSGCDFASYSARKSALSKIIDLWTTACGGKKLLAIPSAYEYDTTMNPYVATTDSYDQYISVQDYDYAMKFSNMTFRCDSGGGLGRYETNLRTLDDLWRSGKRVPILGEFGSGYDDTVAGNTGFDLDESINDILFRFHANYCTVMNWTAETYKSEVLANAYSMVEKGEKLLGYRLNVESARYQAQVSPGGLFKLDTQWSNTAMGRMWQKYYLTFSLLDSKGNVAYSYTDKSFDATQFVSGSLYNWSTEATLPTNLAQGDYRLELSLNDPDTDKPAIELGITGNDGHLRYVLGTVTVKKDSQTIKPDNQYGPMTPAQLSNFAFKANTGYVVTFKYVPGFDISNFKFGNFNGYYFKVDTQQGGSKNEAGSLSWQDVSKSQGVETIVFKTGNFNDYKALFGSDNFGSLSISDVYVNEYDTGVTEEDFEGGSLIGTPTDGNAAVVSNKNAINGEKSLYAKTKGKGDDTVFSTSASELTLKADTSYTVSFKFKAWSDVGNGGYYFLNLCDKTGKTLDTLGMWYERYETPETDKTYTFRTGDAAGDTLVWGIHNGACMSLDNITVIELPEGGAVVAGKTQPEVKNVYNPLSSTMPVKEGFESGSFDGSFFNAGWNLVGSLTDDPKYVISGKWSLLGMPEYYEDYLEFARSKPDVLKLKPGGTYRVQFRYRIVKEPVSSDGYFYFLARSTKGTYSADKSYTRWTGNVGDTGTKNIYIQLDNYDDYQLMFGLYKYGGIVIDDIVVIEAEPIPEFSGTVDFESGSLDTSYMTDGFTSGEGAVVSSDRDAVISGKYSAVAANTKNLEWYEYLYSNKNLIKLKRNTTYTVTFDYKILESTLNNGFFNFFVRTDAGLADVGSITWTGKADTTGSRTVTFKTLADDNYFLAWGIHYKGAISIDNIHLVQNP